MRFCAKHLPFVSWTLALTFALLTGCRTAGKSEAEAKFLQLDRSSFLHFLIQDALRDEIRVCVALTEKSHFDEKLFKQVPSTTSFAESELSTLIPLPEFEVRIRKAITAWLAPLRARGVPVARKVAVLYSHRGECAAFYEDNLNAEPTIGTTVHFTRPNKGSLAGSSAPEVDFQLVPEAFDFSAILHEFGHQFGLADTYINFTGSRKEGIPTTCQPGEPNAVMCQATFTKLQPDDVNGIEALYCREFASRHDAFCATLTKSGNGGFDFVRDDEERASSCTATGGTFANGKCACPAGKALARSILCAPDLASACAAVGGAVAADQKAAGGTSCVCRDGRVVASAVYAQDPGIALCRSAAK